MRFIAVLLFCFPIALTAAGKQNLMKMDVDLNDREALQRGAKLFVNYCLGCHSAAYMRYNRLATDLNIPEDILDKNLIFADAKPGDPMAITMSPTDAKVFFGVTPPDLSVIARVRGADWLYTYLKTFYRDETRPFGVNNLAFKDVSMPHVLWELQGLQQLEMEEHIQHDEHPKDEPQLIQYSAGVQSEAEYDQTVRDLVNFLVYLGEPIKLKRTQIGFWVILYLLVLLYVVYLVKKDYWKDIKG